MSQHATASSSWGFGSLLPSLPKSTPPVLPKPSLSTAKPKSSLPKPNLSLPKATNNKKPVLKAAILKRKVAHVITKNNEVSICRVVTGDLLIHFCIVEFA